MKVSFEVFKRSHCSSKPDTNEAPIRFPPTEIFRINSMLCWQTVTVVSLSDNDFVRIMMKAEKLASYDSARREERHRRYVSDANMIVRSRPHDLCCLGPATHQSVPAQRKTHCAILVRLVAVVVACEVVCRSLHSESGRPIRRGCDGQPFRVRSTAPPTVTVRPQPPGLEDHDSRSREPAVKK